MNTTELPVRPGKEQGIMGRMRIRADPAREARASRFAADLADALYTLGLTHEDVAQALGIARYTVDSWTRAADSRIPGQATLARLCVLLDARQPGLGRRLAATAGLTWTPPPSPPAPLATGEGREAP